MKLDAALAEQFRRALDHRATESIKEAAAYLLAEQEVTEVHVPPPPIVLLMRRQRKQARPSQGELKAYAKRLLGKGLIEVRAQHGQPTRFFCGRTGQFEMADLSVWRALVCDDWGIVLDDATLADLRGYVLIRAANYERQTHAHDVLNARAAYFSTHPEQ